MPEDSHLKFTRDAYFWAVVVLQAILCVVAFNKIVFHPTEQVLYADYDGGKNYFTPYSYISGLGVDKVGEQAHPLKVYGQHYPFGEYVFYTDNTPGVSLPLRALHQLGVPFASGGVAVFSYFFIIAQWLAAIAAYLLLVRVVRPRWIAAVLSILLVWGCKQYWHLCFGSPNLGLTVITLAYIGLLFRLYQRPLKWSRWLVCAGWIGFAAWFHLYYLIIFGTTLALFSVLLFARSAQLNASAPFHDVRSLMLRSVTAGVLGVALIYIPVLLIDDKLALRTGDVLGYGFEAWRLDIASLITPTPDYKSRFLISYEQPVFGERSGYLGLWFLYTLLIGVLVGVWRGFKGSVHALKQLPNGAFLTGFGIVGTLCFFAALGTTYSGAGSDLRWEVVLNPFYAFTDISIIQQFRAIARFFFITWWAWALPLAAYSGLMYTRAGHWGTPGKLVRVALIGALVAGALDARDVVKARNRLHHQNLVGYTATSQYQEELAGLGIDLSQYQGLLIAPYFHVGSQSLSLVADPPNPDYQREAFTLAAATRLPMLNAVTSRTPPHEVKELMELASSGIVGDSLTQLLTQQPILVAINRAVANAASSPDPQIINQYSVPPPGLARNAFFNSLALPDRAGVTPLGELLGYDLYAYTLAVAR